MKAMRNSPEWMSTKIDKYGKEIKGLKNQKETGPIVPFGTMSDFQVHAFGYVPGIGRVDAREGKGPETLPVNVGIVRNASQISDEARMVYNSILKGE